MPSAFLSLIHDPVAVVAQDARRFVSPLEGRELHFKRVVSPTVAVCRHPFDWLTASPVGAKVVLVAQRLQCVHGDRYGLGRCRLTFPAFSGRLAGKDGVQHQTSEGAAGYDEDA